MRKCFLLLFAACIAAISSYAQAPIITSFSPASGPVGTLVTIIGTNLSSPTAFTIGGVSAIVVSDDGTTLVGMVMPGATTGSVSVTTSGAVSISADGNTALIGGWMDSSFLGAAWVFTRSGSTWSQQGNKLVGTGAVDSPSTTEQGRAVALSADGNTAIVGGPGDNGSAGAVWVYTRSGGIWTQQGAKLTSTGVVQPEQGYSVALSADGNTAIVGGPSDNIGIGAVWIYTRSGGVWAGQGGKLIGTGAAGGAYQGGSVALSADGNTAVVGGFYDNGSIGATWVFTRTGSTWSQRGSKLVGTGYVGISAQGYSVSLSACGDIAMVEGPSDNSNRGATWVFASACVPDSSSFSHAICQGDSFLFANMQLTSSGTYNDTLTNINGCDSLVTLTLTVNPLPVVTWVDADTMPWFWCENWIHSPQLYGGSPAGGQYSGQYVVGDTFTIPQNVWDSVYNRVDLYIPVSYTYTDSSGCTNAVSKTFQFLIGCEGISTISGTSLIHLYPNPNHGSFTLETSSSIGSEYTISDMLGNMIAHDVIKANEQVIDMKQVDEGVYTLGMKGAQPIRFVVVR